MKQKLRLLVFAAVSILPGAIKLPLYRWIWGARIGRGVRVGFGAVLVFDHLRLDDGARIGWLSVIRVSSLSLGKRARMGGFLRVECHTIEMGSASTISSWVSILADHRDRRSRLVMGSECWILDYSYVNPARPITLGRNVGVGGGSYLFAHGLWLSKLEGYPVAHGPITIGDDVWLPWGCFILPNVEIGSGTVIGARSLVSKSLPAGVLAAGTPAKVMREQVVTPPTLEERNRLLLESTEEFAQYTGATLALEESDDWTVCRVGGEPVFHLAKRPGVLAAPPLAGHALCVVHDTFGNWRALHPRVYSLVSYQSCEYATIGPLQRRWLAHLRLIGVRYYPVDEVQVEA